MGYVLQKNVAAQLAKTLPAAVDPGVSRVDVRLGPDHAGEDTLFFTVILKDDGAMDVPSAALGKRVQRISMALRQRAAELGLPMFASVRFLLESDVRPPRRKTA